MRYALALAQGVADSPLGSFIHSFIQQALTKHIVPSANATVTDRKAVLVAIMGVSTLWLRQMRVLVMAEPCGFHDWCSQSSMLKKKA